MISRDMIHLPTAGISILCALQGKVAKIYFAFCNPKDVFSKKMARRILEGRLGHNRPPTLEIRYLGNTPRRDVLFPIADFVRGFLGFHFDEESKRFYHPETFGVLAEPSGLVEEGHGVVPELEFEMVEPSTRIFRSPQRVTSAVREFVDENLRPQLELAFRTETSSV